MPPGSTPVLPLAALSVWLLAAIPLGAQHQGHAAPDSAAGPRLRTPSLMVQAVPLLTRADPTAAGSGRTEFAITQVLAMARAPWSDRAALDVTLDLEGITMRRGELSTGAFGEGYVDRRHPHTYLHELVLTGWGGAGPVALSASVGRGFVPFGTDDPMVRPFAKYPLNHHLSQLLERGLLIGAVRAGSIVLEGGLFTGEEPERPSSLPRLRRFGDSWAARLSLIPTSGLELQSSIAAVTSPEQAQGFGLDQRKWSVSARSQSPGGRRYALAEWARTTEHASGGFEAFSYSTVLVEGSVGFGPARAALRLEQTERPEEERLADPFRVGRPATDLSISGITRWRVATLQLSTAGVTRAGVRGVPFLEMARMSARASESRSLFQPATFYGSSRFWMVTVGVRLQAGAHHARMGRYGVAQEPQHGATHAH